MMKHLISIWRIEGYKGNSDCDGPEDYNISMEMPWDNRFDAKDIEEIMASRWSKNYRCVTVKATFLRSVLEP